VLHLQLLQQARSRRSVHRDYCYEENIGTFPDHQHRRDVINPTTCLSSTVFSFLAGPAAMVSKGSNLLLRLILVMLETYDGVIKLLYTTWFRLTAKARAAKAGGSNPPPPTVIGVILAEPNTAGISLHKAASVAAWWVSCRIGPRV
jgi:hypothetical protein